MKSLPLNLAALGALAVAVLPKAASAQEVAPAQPAVVTTAPAAPVTTEKTVSQASGPSLAMVGSGIGIFALSYVPAVIVAGESNLGADKNMYVPLVGPWLDLGQRPGCSAADCNGENTAKVMIVVDGIFQGIGALTILGGFLTPAHETTTVQSADLKPTLHLSPAQMGVGGYGMQAFGTF